MYKKTVRTSLTLILLATFQQSCAYYIEGYSALRNYVQECTGQLFYPNHDLVEVSYFKNDLTNRIHGIHGDWFLIWVKYDSQKVYDAIINESINFIADQAYRYANQHASDHIRNELITRISHMHELPVGIFSQYVGQALKQKIDRICPPTQPRPHTSATLYPSEECCVCYQDFDGHVEQIFLVPCGHDLCYECCRQHFFTYNNHHCPMCRAIVDLERIREIIYAPSAPAAYWFE